MVDADNFPPIPPAPAPMPVVPGLHDVPWTGPVPPAPPMPRAAPVAPAMPPDLAVLLQEAYRVIGAVRPLVPGDYEDGQRVLKRLNGLMTALEDLGLDKGARLVAMPTLHPRKTPGFAEMRAALCVIVEGTAPLAVDAQWQYGGDGRGVVFVKKTKWPDWFKSAMDALDAAGQAYVLRDTPEGDQE